MLGDAAEVECATVGYSSWLLCKGRFVLHRYAAIHTVPHFIGAAADPNAQHTCSNSMWLVAEIHPCMQAGESNALVWFYIGHVQDKLSANDLHRLGDCFNIDSA